MKSPLQDYTVPSAAEAGMTDPKELLQAGDGDIPSGLYEIVLDLAAKEGSEGEFEVSIVHRHGDVNTVLAQTVVTATSTEFEQFTMSVVGIDADAQAGDRLLLTVENLSDHTNQLRFGDLSSGQGYVKVPW